MKSAIFCNSNLEEGGIMINLFSMGPGCKYSLDASLVHLSVDFEKGLFFI